MIDTSGFVEALRGLRFNNAFNPYAETCQAYDLVEAPALRRHNLKLVLDAALDGGVESIWIARDLGYRGGRRTGLALTDEVHLGAHAALLGTAPLKRATRGPAVAERTATVIWEVLRELRRPIFLWNVFPLHPFEEDSPLSNRCHTRDERYACSHLLQWLIERLRPRSVVAIGRDAQVALADLDVAAEQVRHPSYGGHNDFRAGVYSHYCVTPRVEGQTLRLL
ncbi:uracil-DNA glycosylase [Mesorhizobium sp.]|uniref:uracil-DNA glycosylase n=1 Tax=Mesorhizobium sp. TaxID=1871066 RepID=UPI0012137AF0|nr:MAG: uracil-DNA glycosylase [Mesorhizobium sp.]